jgi:hypothetical protein
MPAQALTSPSCPRRRASTQLSTGMWRRVVDSRLRGNDAQCVRQRSRRVHARMRPNSRPRQPAFRCKRRSTTRLPAHGAGALPSRVGGIPGATFMRHSALRSAPTPRLWEISGARFRSGHSVGGDGRPFWRARDAMNLTGRSHAPGFRFDGDGGRGDLFPCRSAGARGPGAHAGCLGCAAIGSGGTISMSARYAQIRGGRRGSHRRRADDHAWRYRAACPSPGTECRHQRGGEGNLSAPRHCAEHKRTSCAR